MQMLCRMVDVERLLREFVCHITLHALNFYSQPLDAFAMVVMEGEIPIRLLHYA